MFSRLRLLLSLLIGDVSWSPPNWPRRLSSATATWVRGHQRTSLALVLALVAIAITARQTWYYYQHRPKPVTVSVKVQSPGVTRLEKELKPDSLRIRFGASVARLEDVNRSTPKPLSANANATPAKAPPKIV